MRTSCSIPRPGITIKSKTASDIHAPAASGAPFRRLALHHLRPYRKWLLWGLIASATAAVSGVSYGGIIKVAGDQLATLSVEESRQSFWFLILLIGAVILATAVRAVAIYAMTVSNNKAVQLAITDLQSRLFGKAIDGNIAQLSSRGAGPFVSQFIHDIEAFRAATLRLITNATKSVLTVIGAVLAMLLIDWVMFVVVIAVYPLAYLPIQFLSRRIRNSATAVQEQMGDLATSLTETAQGVRFFRAYGIEARQKLVAEDHFTRRSELFMQRLGFKAAIDPVLEIAGGVVIAIILGFSAYRIASGAASIGDVLGFITLIGVVAPELRALGGLVAVLQDGSAAAGRMMDQFDVAHRAGASVSIETVTHSSKSLTFENVSFSYSSNTSLLKDISFAVEEGRWVAISGASGAGKSTLLDICMAFIRPTSGSVKLGRRPIDQLPESDLRQLMSYVEQDTVLIEDTVRANLLLVRTEASETDIERACSLAGLATSIKRWPMGLDTPLGPQGKTLSGGEARRLAIARALLHDGPILLLDEILTGIDPETQRSILEHLKDLSGKKTILQVTHDPKVAKIADIHLVLQDGSVHEHGPAVSRVHQTQAGAQ